ncbi:MAG: sugar ABC transporter substrate-binding protein [Candidatus Limiplasma sp.]|nr:sugar ABC transporter substrate-binding protein [Candidatus Limiplasma sp.]
MRNPWKKWVGFSLSLTLALSMLLVGGCAVAENGAAELEGDITFWHSFTQGARMEAVQAAADEFMKMHPKVKITIETFSWGDFNTKWNAGVTTGDLPDMSTAQNTGEVIEMVNAGVLASADSLIDAIGRDRFSANALTDMTWDGITYGVPYYSHAQVMWYRSDLLEKAGLAVPKTWREFYDAAVALTKDGTYGAAFSSSTNDLLCTRYLNYYVRSGGGSLLTEDLRANLTSDLAIEGINFWLNVYKNCSPAETINYTVLDHATLFYQGITAFDFNSGFMISGVQNNTPDIVQYVDSAPLPKINEGDPDYSAEATHIPLVIWEKAEHPEVCEAFIQFLYQEDNYIRFLDAVPVGMLPAISGIDANPKYTQNPTVQQFAHSVEVITGAIEKGSAIGFEHGASVQASFLTSQGVIEAMFQDILTNGTDVREAAKAAEDQLNEIFDTMID